MKRIACLCLGAIVVSAFGAAEGPAEIRISHFSGKPVPRFETLRHTTANGRSGPSLDHRIVWQYERKGLPLLIIKESQNWRRVRDPDGDEVWVHARMLTDAATIMVQNSTSLRRRADPDSPVTAHIDRGIIANVLKCDAVACRVKAGTYKGWIDRQALWGLDVTETGL